MKWLYILRHAPYGSPRFAEAIDAMLVAGVFEQPLAVLLTDDAVQVLRADQDGAQVDGKTASKQLSALPDYDITDIYVCAPSAARAGIKDTDTDIAVTFVDHQQQAELIAQCTQVFND